MVSGSPSADGRESLIQEQRTRTPSSGSPRLMKAPAVRHPLFHGGRAVLRAVRAAARQKISLSPTWTRRGRPPYVILPE
jgi:hypothetical protein